MTIPSAPSQPLTGTVTVQQIMEHLQRLTDAGAFEEAVELAQQALAAGARNTDLLVQIIKLYMQAGKGQEAYAVGREALARAPNHFDVRFQLGLVSMRVNRYEEALEHFRVVLRLQPDNVPALTNLGAVYYGLGFVRESLDALRAALGLAPDLLAVWQNYVSILNYDEDVPLPEVFAQHREAGRRMLAAAGPRPASYANDPTPDRPIRIGYLSGDFLMHPASHYIEPVLRLHDRSRFDLYAYSLLSWSDPVTEGFRKLVPNWREAALLNHDQLFRAIQADRIDILIDLSGHTARNQILTVARKPAPVAVNWIGYLNTMGIPGIDYAILDPHLLSPEAAAGFVEQPYLLPETAYCYAPLIADRAPAPAPFARNGFITFGCFNNPAKVSRTALRTWAEIIRRTPGSRLLFKYKTYDEPNVQRRVLEALAAEGVGANRVDFQGYSPLGSFMDSFGAIDVALDTFPYTGITTTMHTLWIGVPVVTMEGATPMQRFGRTALYCIGRPDWVARTPEEYVSIALGVVEEVKANPDLRRDVQRRMQGSAMMRHGEFVRALEAGYRDMWARWCVEHGRG